MAEHNISTEQVNFGKSYVHIRRVKDFPKMVLNHQVGHRNEFFRCKVSIEDQESTLSLVLYPGSYDVDHSDYVAIRASLDQEIDCKIVIEIAICGRGNVECFKRRLMLTKDKKYRAVVKDFVSKSILLNNADLLRDNDYLKIACRLSINYEENESAFDAEQLVTEYRNSHMHEYGRLFENGDFSDFKLKVGDTEFNVHKCILATHSPVFAAMFRSDMSEKNKASTDIQDVDAKTFRELLRFIYVAKVDQLDEHASNLWIAADKYQVSALKEFCELSMIEKLSVYNILDTLCFLDKFSTMGKLKAAAIECIIDNAEVITSDDNFKGTIKKLSAELLSDVLCASLKKTTIAL